MNYLGYCYLLPSFIATTLKPELVDKYFAAFPPATSITVSILSDNAGYDPNVPFDHNRLLELPQKLINSDSLNKDTLALVLNVLDYIDFKYALIFFIELKESFSYEFLCSRLEEENATVFLERLNIFLSVYCPEFLCLDRHDSLL